MALNYVELTCDLYDGQGSFLQAGTATFTPSAVLTDTADHELVAQIPVTVAFRPYGLPVVRLLATDNGSPLPSGWQWQVVFTGLPGAPAPFSFYLPYAAGASQYLSGQAPVQSVAAMMAYLLLTGGQMTGELSPAVVTLTDAATITVNAGAGNDFRVTLGGSRTLGNPSGGTDGQKITFDITSAGYTLSYGSAYEFTAAGPPALASGAGYNDLLGFRFKASKGKWQFLGSPAGGFA